MVKYNPPRLNTLKKAKEKQPTKCKNQIEKIDDAFVNLHIKLRSIILTDVISKINRKLKGAINLENLPKLVDEINEEWAGKRKISFSVTNLKKIPLAPQVLYHKLDVRKDEKHTATRNDEKKAIVALIPLSFSIKEASGVNSFHTLLLEDLKVKGVKTYGLKDNKAQKERVSIRDFRRFFTKEILWAEIIRFSRQRGKDIWQTLLNSFICSKLSYRYEISGRNIRFQPNSKYSSNLWFKVPESEFVYKSINSTRTDKHAFLVGVGIKKEQMGFFASSREAGGLGFKWFTKKYARKAVNREVDWEKTINDKDAVRFEEQHRKMASKFIKISKALEIDLFVFDCNNPKCTLGGTLCPQQAPQLPPRSTQTTLKDATINIFTDGTKMMLNATFLHKKLSCQEAISAPNKGENLPIFFDASETILDAYLKYFFWYRVASIQFDWEEKEAEKKGERARSYQDTKEFQLANKSYLEKSKNHLKVQYTQNEFLAKLAHQSPLKQFFTNIELDLDTDPKLFQQFEQDVCHFISIIGKEPKNNRFKVRKLGNHKALGLYYPSKKTLVIDVNSPSSFTHEYGHLLDALHKDLSEQNEFQDIIISTIDILHEKLYKLPKNDPIKKRLINNSKYNFEYYAKPREIFARAFETYCAFTLNMDLSILEPKSTYSTSFEYITARKHLDIVANYFNIFFEQPTTNQEQ